MAAPETLAQARTWEIVKGNYLADGLCYPCAAQAAWGHQAGWSGIRPPCDDCAPVVAGFPVAAGGHWRRWPKGDRRPVRGAGKAADAGHSLTPSPEDHPAPAMFKTPLRAAGGKDGYGRAYLSPGCREPRARQAEILPVDQWHRHPHGGPRPQWSGWCLFPGCGCPCHGKAA